MSDPAATLIVPPTFVLVRTTTLVHGSRRRIIASKAVWFVAHLSIVRSTPWRLIRTALEDIQQQKS